MKVKIKRTPDKAIEALDKIAQKLKGKNNVLVGLPKESNNYPDGTSIITVGVVHEFGSPEHGIPQRSYLRSTLDSKKSEYKSLLTKLSRKMVTGGLTMATALDTLGLKLQSDVQATIADGIDPELKHREGTPLYDTGHLVQSITYKVGD